MKLTVNKYNADRFDDLVYQICEDENKDLFEGVMSVGRSLIASMTRPYEDLYFNSNFADDVLVECLQRILIEEKTVSPTKVLRNITHEYIEQRLKEADIILPETPDVQAHNIDIQSRLIFEETLQSTLNLLPLHVQSAVLYLIYFSNREQMFKRTYSTLDYFLIVKTINYLRKSLSFVEDEAQEYFDFNLPVSQTARLLLVSSLYKLSPALLVLIMQTKNLDLVLQFCKLFGNQSVKIPTIAKLSETIEHAAELARKVEDGFRVGDQESLAYLATELEGIKQVDYSKLYLNPLLSSFIEQSLQTTLKNYAAYQKRLVSSVDTTDSKDILRVYDIMNKEIFSQANLLLQLTTTIDDYSSIRNVLIMLKQQTRKNHNNNSIITESEITENDSTP